MLLVSQSQLPRIWLQEWSSRLCRASLGDSLGPNVSSSWIMINSAKWCSLLGNNISLPIQRALHIIHAFYAYQIYIFIYTYILHIRFWHNGILTVIIYNCYYWCFLGLASSVSIFLLFIELDDCLLPPLILWYSHAMMLWNVGNVHYEHLNSHSWV